jgi:hypothetical protein
MASDELTEFVRSALRAGASRPETAAGLVEAGWSREQVEDALADFAPVAFVVPVPRPRPRVSARDAFLYLVMFGMLYVSAYQFGSLLFQFVNLAFPDPVVDARESGQLAGMRIRFAIASLTVAFPVFLFVALRINARVQADPAQRNSGVRKWLTYLTLFVAACVIVGDAIALLNGLLAGELTARFLLKSGVVGAIAGGVFGYYLWSMRADDAALGR